MGQTDSLLVWLNRAAAGFHKSHQCPGKAVLDSGYAHSGLQRFLEGLHLQLNLTF